MNAHRSFPLALALICVAAATPQAARADEAAYYKACFLQNEERDFAAAVALFEQAAGDEQLSKEIRAAATRRLAECREELAVADLAGLMPAESLAYVQLANIGAQATTVLESLGLAKEPRRVATGQRIPIEPGLSFPIDFALSPALVREIGKFGGVAAALTGFDDSHVPQGVVVIHVGDSDLVRGLLETSLQVVTPNESIAGYATYRIPADGVDVWMAQTERLLVLSPSRDQVSGVVNRIKSGSAGGSLKEATSFRATSENRERSLLFAWADSQRAAPLVNAAMQQEMNPQELMAARTILNLEQIESATLSVGATEGGFRSEAAVRFKPGHRHLLYGLLRTAPIGADALRYVPGDAAVVAAIGLNPPTGAGATGDGVRPQIALMDLGREFFSNVRSASVFVTPSKGGQPDVGVVVFAQDANKSRELWTQLIGLPAQFGLAPAEATGETKIHGHAATRYAYPGAPAIFVTQAGDDALVIGTAGAVENSLISAEADEKAPATRLLSFANPATSKAVFVQIGSLVRCGAAKAGEHERDKLAAVAPLVDDMTAGLTIDEDANELRVRLEVAGVPQVAELLKTVAEQATLAASSAPAAHAPGR